MTKKHEQWMPIYIDAYLADTLHLKTDQHGAYLLLIMAYWMRGSALKDNDAELAAITKSTPAEWVRLRPIISPFFKIEGGFWKQKRIKKELIRAKNIIKVRSEAGKLGVKAKKLKAKDSEANASANGQANAQQTATPLPLPLPFKKEDLRNFVVGRGGDKSGNKFPMTDENKIALFQKWLAEGIGTNGWRIVGTAADPDAEGYSEALAFCKKWAREHGKGWPHKWPAPKTADSA